MFVGSGVRIVKTPIRSPGEFFSRAVCGNAPARVPGSPADLRRTAPAAGLRRVRAALQRSSAPPVAGTTTSAAPARPADRSDRPDQAQTSRPRPDQRVPESSLTSTENTSSETVCELWHGTGHTGRQTTSRQAGIDTLFRSAKLCASGGSVLDLLDCAKDHRRGALD